ncbi:complement factor H-related protein 3-like [Branchiostoma floridae x Branchiostoma belcheri]
MPRPVIGVLLLLAAVGLLSPRRVLADGDPDDELHEHDHVGEHLHECPEGYEEHEGHCYYFSSDTETYSGASAFCEAQDGRLAAPDCHDEHAAEFFYRTVAWISPNTEEDCARGHHTPEDQLPFICVHAPTCDTPPVHENTVMTECEPPYDQHEGCHYACVPGYHLYEGNEVSSIATCLDGNWHGPYMTCKADCPVPPLNPGVTMKGASCQAPYISGDICFFECEDVQQPLEGDHDMSCLDGGWIHAVTELPGVPLVCP